MARALASALVCSSLLGTLLAACGGGGGSSDTPKFINIDRANMECPLGDKSGTGSGKVPASATGFQVKAAATLSDIRPFNLAWTWTPSNANVKFVSQTTDEATASATATFSMPAGQATGTVVIITIEAHAEGKQGDSTCAIGII
jgi:hypothetical protein